VPTFGEYAKGWWEWESCPYLKKRRKRYKLTQGYVEHAKRNMKNMLVPYFGNMPITKITEGEIERFLDYLTEKKKFKNTTANDFLTTLKTMMIEAADRRVIPIDPTRNVAKLINDRKEIRIITPQEFKKLFASDWRKVWNDNLVSCAANKLAALTGMRTAEVLGLKGCYVYEQHIYLCMQYDRFGYRETKTKAKQNIPLPASLIRDLNELKEHNGDGFVFSLDGGAKPICRVTMYRDFHRALKNIGVADDVIGQRKLHLHGWRHFFNTELLKGGLTVPQTQAITGHKSERMTEWYNHFDRTEFTKAMEVQESYCNR
jgi:integrase